MAGMGQDPNMNFFSQNPETPEKGKVKQFVDKKHDMYHWSNLSKFLRQDQKTHVCSKENRMG